jgi:hypothetical protein
MFEKVEAARRLRRSGVGIGVVVVNPQVQALKLFALPGPWPFVLTVSS